MERAICVYSSSSDEIGGEYFQVAEELGKCLAQNGYTLVYGGGGIGLMGAMARSAHGYGGKVIGIIPEALNRKGIVYEGADQVIITKTMRERKQKMEDLAEAFLVMPGGFGTLEEFLEILTLKQLQYHNKPVVVLNINGFYQPLLDMFERVYELKFAKEAYREFYFVAGGAVEALGYIRDYSPPEVMEKWFGYPRVQVNMNGRDASFQGNFSGLL